MNFMEAVYQMKQGKKVRRLGGLYLCDLNKELRLFDESGNTPLHLCDIEATDWEVVEEKNTLWERIHSSYPDDNYPVFDVDDVKETLKEFIHYIEEKVYISELTNTLNKATEIFGKELLEREK